MSCNHKCTTDPCAICTPPGVTGLTTCQPVDPCDEKVNIDCVKYNGIDFSCLNVKNGDDLISVLIAILNYYFPPSYCCKLEGQLTSFPPATTTTTTSTTTSTSTSTTSTSSTTTTTTAVPCVCYKLTNNKTASVPYSYVDCATRQTIASSVDALSIKYQCAVDKSIVQGELILDTIGPCSQGCPATTSTTTTSSTTTSSTTTSTSSTTTTTTSGPCNCYRIVNTESIILYYSYTECGNNPNNLLPPSGTPIAPGETDYICAVPGSIVLDIGLVLTNLGACSLGCPPPPPPPPDINCTQIENFVVYNGSSSNIINDLTGVVWYTWAGGPVLPNNVEKGAHGIYSGSFGVDITVNPGGAGGCIKVFVNGVEQDSATVLTSTIYILNVNALDSDCVQIILTDDPC